MPLPILKQAPPWRRGARLTSERSMNLHIRDMDSDTYQALARQAAQNHRSLSAEAAARLACTLAVVPPDPRGRRRALLAQLREASAVWPVDLPVAEVLLGRC